MVAVRTDLMLRFDGRKYPLRCDWEWMIMVASQNVLSGYLQCSNEHLFEKRTMEKRMFELWTERAEGGKGQEHLHRHHGREVRRC